MSLYGYAGKITWVDLTNSSVWNEPITEEMARSYIGGRGLAVRIFYDRLPPGIDPFAPENILAVVTGPINGTMIPSSGRYAIVTKSPLTGLVQDAHSGGYFGPELKYAGLDGIFIKGKASKPVYILVKNGTVEIRDASAVWGKDVFAADKLIKKECNDEDLRICAIGRAGEKQVRFAGIINEWYRAAARNGGGAVMGSKNLKAIAVRGNGEVTVKDAEEVKEIWKKLTPLIQEKQRGMFLHGSALGLSTFNEMGIYPVKNFTTSVFEGAKRIDGEYLTNTRLVKRRGCYGCVLLCSRFSVVKDGPYKGTYTEGPEYETCWSFGGDVGNDNLDTVIKANVLCNEYGLDTISTGSVVGFAMECSEKGLITKEQLGGLELSWGNEDTILKIVEMIASREGIGEILAEGTKKAAERIGKGAERFAIQAKGLELSAYEPRAIQGMGLSFATSNVGGHHTKAWTPGPELWATTLVDKPLDPFSTERKPWLVKKIQDSAAIVDSLILCTFVSPASSGATTVDDFAQWMYAVAGLKMSTEEVWKAGERIFNLERVLNARENPIGRVDTLPERLLTEPLSTGPARGQVVKLDKMLPLYYDERGWKGGLPTQEKLRELGLEFASHDVKLLNTRS